MIKSEASRNVSKSQIDKHFNLIFKPYRTGNINTRHLLTASPAFGSGPAPRAWQRGKQINATSTNRRVNNINRQDHNTFNIVYGRNFILITLRVMGSFTAAIFSRGFARANTLNNNKKYICLS